MHFVEQQQTVQIQIMELRRRVAAVRAAQRLQRRPSKNRGTVTDYPKDILCELQVTQREHYDAIKKCQLRSSTLEHELSVLTKALPPIADEHGYMDSLRATLSGEAENEEFGLV